jgi:hypothetical protein
MKCRITIFSALFSFLISATYGIEKGAPHGTVIDLKDETFDDLVTSDPANGLWLLKFYAPWLVYFLKMPFLEFFRKIPKNHCGFFFSFLSLRRSVLKNHIQKFA